jgi:hypothetical protein
MSSDHAAQNLRTNSIGLSIWLLLWSTFGNNTAFFAHATDLCQLAA